MPTTTNYGWTTPADTDLVKDGASAIRTLGTAIDTTVFNNASAAIAKTIVDAKGDIIAATAADTVARLAVGANDTVLTADSSTATGLKWATPAAGGMTLISTTTLTGSSVTISSIPATYINLYLIVRGAYGSGDGFDFNMRLNGDTNNRYTETASGSQGDVTFPNSAWTLAIGADNASTNGLATVLLPDYANTTSWKMATNHSISNSWSTPANLNAIRYMQAYNQTAAISSITLFPASGTWTAGTAYLYGVK